MKKETFVKIINAILDAHIRRDTLHGNICKALEKRIDVTGEYPSLYDLIYDEVLEKEIMESFVNEFGEENTDKIYKFVYEDHYEKYTKENIEELFDNLN